MTALGKLLLVVGGIIFLLGIVILIAARFHVPIGRLPGDVIYRGKNTTFYFPLATSILLSILLSLLFYAISRFR